MLVIICLDVPAFTMCALVAVGWLAPVHFIAFAPVQFKLADVYSVRKV
jgi:hypothetical protein